MKFKLCCRWEIPLHSRAFNDWDVPEVRFAEPGVFIEWELVNGADSYYIEILKNERVVDQFRTELLRHRLNGLKEGRYHWQVMAQNGTGIKSQWSKRNIFTVSKTKELRWMENSTEYYYLTEDPQVLLQWDKGSEQAEKWSVRYAARGGDILDSKWIPTKKNEVTIKLKKAGTYQFQARAESIHDEILALARIRSLKVAPLPLLRPPELKQNPRNALQANRDGSFDIQWIGVKGAASYGVEFKGLASEKSQFFTTEELSLKLKKLKPGKYKFRLSSFNARKKVGKFGRIYRLVVPDISDIRAPKVKRIRVND